MSDVRRSVLHHQSYPRSLNLLQRLLVIPRPRRLSFGAPGLYSLDERKHLRAFLPRPDTIMSTVCTALCLALVLEIPDAHKIELARATVVVRERGAAEAERTAVTVLIEEAEKRTGVRWSARSEWPNSGAVIVATSSLDDVDSEQVRAKGSPRESRTIEAGRIRSRHRPVQPRATSGLDHRSRCSRSPLSGSASS